MGRGEKRGGQRVSRIDREIKTEEERKKEKEREHLGAWVSL